MCSVSQRAMLENIFRACVGLPPDSYMTLEHKLPSALKEARAASEMDADANGADELPARKKAKK